MLMSSFSFQASVFSGYTVVGIPTQAYNQGWIALQWVTSIPMAIVGFLAVAPRLRKIGVLRRHQSPVDFITDRYQSQILRYTTTLLMIVPTLIYLSAQLAAIRSTFNSLFNIQPDSPWAVVGIAGIIVLCEWIGGMRSVAFTDCIQGIVMIACFVALPWCDNMADGVTWNGKRILDKASIKLLREINNGCFGTLVSCSWALQ
jgi:solute:Na+ symporter, SSS family